MSKHAIALWAVLIASLVALVIVAASTIDHGHVDHIQVPRQSPPPAITGVPTEAPG